LPAGTSVLVNPKQPLITPAAPKQESRDPVPDSSQKTPRKTRVVLAPADRRQAVIDYHLLGPERASKKWNVSASSIHRFVTVVRAVAAGDLSAVGERHPILGVTSHGGTAADAQALLAECVRAAQGKPPETQPKPAQAPPAPIVELPQRPPEPPPPAAAIQTTQIPQRATAKYDDLSVRGGEDRDITLLTLRTRIAGLEAELNRMTLQLRDAEHKNEKLRKVIHTLTEGND
jgi:hypothetical protein